MLNQLKTVVCRTLAKLRNTAMIRTSRFVIIMFETIHSEKLINVHVIRLAKDRSVNNMDVHDECAS